METLTNKQKVLLGAIIGLLRAVNGDDETLGSLKCLLSSAYKALITKENLDEVINEVEMTKESLVPNCKYCCSPCGRTANLDFDTIKNNPKKLLIVEKLLSTISSFGDLNEINNIAFSIDE